MTIRPKLITQKEAAEMIGVNPHRLGWLVKVGKIKAIDVSAGKDRDLRFALEDIDRFLQGLPPFIVTVEPDPVSVIPRYPKGQIKDSNGRFTPEQIARMREGGLSK